MSTITTTARPEATSRLRQNIIQHPLLAYFSIAFVGAWLFVSPLVFSQVGLRLLPFTLPAPLLIPFLLLGALAGPTLGAFVVTATLDGKAGVRALLRRYLRWRVGLRWYLLVLVVQPLVIILALSLWLGSALTAFIQHWQWTFSLYLPLIPTFFFLGGPLGEEPGWRGFALPRLQQRYGALVGSLILGFFWGTWHLPAYFVQGWLGPFTVPVFVGGIIAGMAGSIIVTWIYNNTRESIFIAILFHAASNAAITLAAHLLPAGLPHSGLVFFILASNGVGVTAYGIWALLIIIGTRGRLAYHPESVSTPVKAQAYVGS